MKRWTNLSMLQKLTTLIYNLEYLYTIGKTKWVHFSMLWNVFIFFLSRLSGLPLSISSFKEPVFFGAKGSKFNSAESAALPLRNVCLTKTSICDDSLLNLQRDDSSRRQSCIFQCDTLVNNMLQLSGTVFTAGLCCRPQHNKSSCLEMWTPSFHFGHPQ